MDGSDAKSSAPKSTPPTPDFSALGDDELLQTRICDLKLKIAGTELESRIEKFNAELTAKNIAVKPICYLGDEWFCPEGCATIAIPFYLAHPRLKKLEEKMMMEVEGGTEAWCMRLLRHEMGHVLNHAYLLEKNKLWQKLFGPASLEYSESFRARPYSRRFVRHLDDYYAQSHPEEDFAETVAIWLTPDLDWHNQYKGWKALEKLEYVDELMHKLAGKPPLVFSRAKISDATRLRSRLEAHYKRRRRLYAQEFPEFFDADLKKLFARGSAVTGRRARHSFFTAKQQTYFKRRLGLDRRTEVYDQPSAALPHRALRRVGPAPQSGIGGRGSHRLSGDIGGALPPHR